MKAIQAVAQHLNIEENLVLEVQEWKNVLWVRVAGARPRFVSKKVLAVPAAQGWKISIPTLDGNRYTVKYVGDLQVAKSFLTKRLSVLAIANNSQWEPMSQEEIKEWVANAESDCDRF